MPSQNRQNDKGPTGKWVWSVPCGPTTAGLVLSMDGYGRTRYAESHINSGGGEGWSALSLPVAARSAGTTGTPFFFPAFHMSRISHFVFGKSHLSVMKGPSASASLMFVWSTWSWCDLFWRSETKGCAHQPSFASLISLLWLHFPIYRKHTKRKGSTSKEWYLVHPLIHQKKGVHPVIIYSKYMGGPKIDFSFYYMGVDFWVGPSSHLSSRPWTMSRTTLRTICDFDWSVVQWCVNNNRYGSEAWLAVFINRFGLGSRMPSSYQTWIKPRAWKSGSGPGPAHLRNKHTTLCLIFQAGPSLL